MGFEEDNDSEEVSDHEDTRCEDDAEHESENEWEHDPKPESGMNEVHEIVGKVGSMSPETMNAPGNENEEKNANEDSTNEEIEVYDGINENDDGSERDNKKWSSKWKNSKNGMRSLTQECRCDDNAKPIDRHGVHMTYLQPKEENQSDCDDKNEIILSIVIDSFSTTPKWLDDDSIRFAQTGSLKQGERKCESEATQSICKKLKWLCQCAVFEPSRIEDAIEEDKERAIKSLLF